MSSEALAQVLPLVLIVVVFWLLIVRPARRRQSEAARLRASLAPGDTVLMRGGAYGRIDSIDDADNLHVEIAPGTVVRMHRDFVVSSEKPGNPDDDNAQDGAD